MAKQYIVSATQLYGLAGNIMADGVHLEGHVDIPLDNFMPMLWAAKEGLGWNKHHKQTMAAIEKLISDLEEKTESPTGSIQAAISAIEAEYLGKPEEKVAFEVIARIQGQLNKKK